MRSKAILVLGCLIILYFILSQIFYWGYNLAILALGLALVVFSMQKPRKWMIGFYKGLRKSARVFLLAVLASLLASFVFIEGLMIGYSTGDKLPEKADYLLILGASVWGEELSKSLQSRLDKGLEYLAKHPGTTVIVSGGRGKGEAITEAEAMKRYLAGHGVDPGTIIKEDKSTSTYENFKFTRELLQKEGQFKGKKYIVVTNDFHTFRARMLAKRQGFFIYALPCRTQWYLAPNSYVREYFAVIKSYVLDRW